MFKRQDVPIVGGKNASLGEMIHHLAAGGVRGVSFTNLTLPTSGLVEIVVVAGSVKKKKYVTRTTRRRYRTHGDSYVSTHLHSADVRTHRTT